MAGGTGGRKSAYQPAGADYSKTFKVLTSLPVDVFLSSHGNFFGLLGKFKRLEQGETPNPFIDTAGYKSYVNQTASAFFKALGEQR